MNKTKLNIGFDIGITSIGWSIIDENLNIIDMGVRLFDDVADPKDGKLKNDKRRSHRSLRRRIQRTRLRKMKFIKYLIDHKWIKNDEKEIYKLLNVDITKFGVNNPIELRVKALNEKIEFDELIFLLFNYLHHRGWFYELDEEEENKKETKKDNEKKEIKERDENYKINENITASENILNFYKKNEYYKNSWITNSFSNKDYIKEIEKILNKQKEYHKDKIDKNFIDFYINECFSKIRKFTEGPGVDWYNNSNFSRLDKNDFKFDENGKLIKDLNKYELPENIWLKTIGKCTYYKDERRGFKKAPITLVFNFLNDLNNFRIDDNYLNEEQKEWILKNVNELAKKYLNNEIDKLTFTFNKIFLEPLNEKLKKEDKIDNKKNFLSGLKTKDKKDLIIEDLTKYIEIIKFIKKYNLYSLNNNFDVFDTNENCVLDYCNKLFDELALKGENNERKEYLINIIVNKNNKKENTEDLNKDVKKILADSNFTKTSGLSYKAMLDYIKYVLKNKNKSLNQMQFFQENFKENIKQENNNKTKYLQSGLYNDAILSPTVRRAFNQNINVLNSILKKYIYSNKNKDKYFIENIVIEIPRDNNSLKEKKRIDDINKKNEKLIKEILSKNNKSDLIGKLSNVQKTRLKLWNEQSGFDFYDGKKIDFDEVLSGKDLEIDHILPHKITNDDSLSNKILVKKENNQYKRKRTVYQWLSTNEPNRTFKSFKEFKEFVNKNKQNLSKEKTKKLLYEGNFSDLDFIERNLVDTRYASKLILNTLQSFFNNHQIFKDNENKTHTKIKVINGSLTSYARNNLFVNEINRDGKKYKEILLPKNRDIYNHHAIDASIVCYLGISYWLKDKLDFIRKIEQSLNKQKWKFEEDKYINIETGEVIKFDIESNEIKKQAKEFAQKLSKYNPEVEWILTDDETFKIDKKELKDKLNKIKEIKADSLKKFIENLIEYLKENNCCPEIINKFNDILSIEKDDDKKKEIKKLFKSKIINDQNLVKFSRLLTHRSNISLSDETIYSYIKDKNNNKGYILDNVYLVFNSSGEYVKKTELEKYFSLKAKPQDYEKLQIYKQNKELFEKLKNIFNDQRYNVDKNNPFIEYMNQNYKEIYKPKFLLLEHNKTKIHLNNLKSIGDTISIDNVIDLSKDNYNKINYCLNQYQNKEFNNKNDRIAINKSLNWLSLRLYKSNETNKEGKNKLKIIPINAKVLTYDKHKKMIVDEKKLDVILEQEKITNKKYKNIIRGQTLIYSSDEEKNLKNKLFYVAGYTNGYLEIKSLSLSNKLVFPRDQMQISLSTIIENYSFADIDDLGNIYNIQEIKNIKL